MCRCHRLSEAQAMWPQLERARGQTLHDPGKHNKRESFLSQKTCTGRKNKTRTASTYTQAKGSSPAVRFSWNGIDMDARPARMLKHTSRRSCKRRGRHGEREGRGAEGMGACKALQVINCCGWEALTAYKNTETSRPGK